jgi:iron complex outermembrane receptor protein
MELSLAGKIAEGLDLGANYTWQVRHIRTPDNVAPLQLTGDPMYKGFIYIDWQALPDFTVTPNLSLASNRWTSNTAGKLYFKTGAFALAGISFDYRVAGHFDINAGIKNLFDQNYQLTAGFPEPGRSFFLGLRYRQ